MNGRLTLHIGMTTARMQFLITCFITTVLVNIVMSQQTLQPEPYIIFANSIDIRRLNFDGTNYDQIVGGLQNVVALDYDIATGYIYWSDHILHKIQRAKIDNGNEIEDFLVDDLVQPDGIALDWKNRRLFFTDSARGVVERIDLDGNNRVVLILGSDIAPRGISVDPHSNWMYFTNVNQVNPTIEKARMSDGTERTVLFDGAGSRLSKPNGITIDYYERMLYWVDAETDKIERSNLNGQNRTVLLNEPSTFHPYGVSQYEDRLYWTDQHQHHIININKKTGRDRVQITGYFTYPTAIHVVHPDRQLGADIDSCQANNGRGECDHICFDQYGTYICACRSGYQLADDDHTCLGENQFECFIDLFAIIYHGLYIVIFLFESCCQINYIRTELITGKHCKNKSKIIRVSYSGGAI
ncbi:low-density lipoprotein receptor-related protein 5-like [Glandiceps talaboti]